MCWLAWTLVCAAVLLAIGGIENPGWAIICPFMAVLFARTTKDYLEGKRRKLPEYIKLVEQMNREIGALRA